MPLFKVWNVFRNIRKFVIADTLEEFKEKCFYKFGFPCDPNSLKIVLESDGTEVDDTEILLLLQKEILIVLTDYESWVDPSTERSIQEPSRIPVPVISPVQCVELPQHKVSSPSFNCSFLTPKTTLTICDANPVQNGSDHKRGATSHSESNKKIIALDLEANDTSSSSPVPFSRDFTRDSSEPSFSNHSSTTRDIPRETSLSPFSSPPLREITRETPLPTFSKHVTMNLNKGDSDKVWNKMIDECARYYLQICPTMSRRTEYQLIGEEMTTVYPAIIHEGKSPWSYFTSSLSRRVRHLRWAERNRSHPTHQGHTETSESSTPYPVLLASVNDSFEATLEGFQKACLQAQESDAPMQEFLKETFFDRRKWMDSLSGPPMANVLQKYPCFDKGSMIMFELKLILGAPVVTQAPVHWQSFKSLVKGKAVYTSKQNGFREEVEFLEYISEETKFNQGRNEKWETFIEIQENIEDHDVSLHLASKALGPPKLIVFVVNGVISCSMVAGESVVIDTEAKTIVDAVLVLMATYFCFGIQYPRAYSQVLGILQEFCLKQSYQGPKSKRYISFTRLLSL